MALSVYLPTYASKWQQNPKKRKYLNYLKEHKVNNPVSEMCIDIESNFDLYCRFGITNGFILFESMAVAMQNQYRYWTNLHFCCTEMQAIRRWMLNNIGMCPNPACIPIAILTKTLFWIACKLFNDDMLLEGDVIDFIREFICDFHPVCTSKHLVITERYILSNFDYNLGVIADEIEIV